MSNVKILDCTLRDGGYINEWDFGQHQSQEIVSLLNKANIDYIEIGFLTEENTNDKKTLFNSFENIKYFLPDNINPKKLFGMITYSKFPITKVPDAKDSSVKGIRLIFKKKQKNNALQYCKDLKIKGYKLFINPTFIDQYSDVEILDLIKEINEIKPYGISIVDSMGVLKEPDLLRLFYIIDNNLDNKIALCFHSHNNLQLSFSNAQCLLKLCKKRELIIDSTVFGIGRGAGNLCTELITQYVNDNYNGNYNIIPILKIIDEQINPIFARTPWGYSVPYYLAAANSCHPNYATYLVNKQTVSVDTINTILKNIPPNKKATYDKELINQMYLTYQEYIIDDTTTKEKLKNTIYNKIILVLAPGKSLLKEKDKINEFISKHNPFIISLNFIPDNYKTDLVFITNKKRYDSLPKINIPYIITSNIKTNDTNANILNYSSYLNNSEMPDNVALMFFKLMELINIKSIYVAGLDGFSQISSENYFDNELINNSKLGEFDKRNKIMSEELNKINTKVNLYFITNTLYCINNYEKV